MNPLTQKTNLPFDRHKAAVHTSDLIISAVVSLFIVAAISYSIGIDNLSFSVSHNTVLRQLSILQSLESFNLELQQKDSLLLGCSMIMGFCIITIIGYSLVHTHLSTKIDIADAQRRQKYQDYFSGTIAQKPHSIKLNQSRNKQSKSNKKHLSLQDLTNINNRILLLKELKGMHSLISGEEKLRLKELYYGLGFIDELPAKFKSPDWVQRVEAIREVKQFEVSKYYPTIFKLINDQNNTVRRNSIIARIDLEENPLNILSDIESKLSNWEKHNIALALDKLPSHLIPSFGDLMIKYPLHHEFLSEMRIHFNQEFKLDQVKPKLHVV